MIDPFRFAAWVSAEARAAFRALSETAPAPEGLEAVRQHYDAYNRRLLADALEMYPVEISHRQIGGVPVQSVVPQTGVTRPGTLICLHGGAFMWGAGAGALLEAVPLAVACGCEVLAVDYRLAPEHCYPAAVDDVLAVYRDVLTRQDADRVGIYGCSAGGMLTAQAVARMIDEELAVPGAIAMLHGTGLDFVGDLAAAAPAFNPLGNASDLPSAKSLPYFTAADLDDPLVMPGNHPDILARFPPSLLVSATRDFAASACSVMHRRLLAAGVDARFVLFDGLWHAHHMAAGLPESQETFALLERFFAEHLQ
jgi:acetyl esterase/lipase